MSLSQTDPKQYKQNGNISLIPWYNQNNLKRSINNAFITISTHVYLNNHI